MKIYAYEMDDGLAEVIEGNTTIAYSSPLSIYTPSKKQKLDVKSLINKTLKEKIAFEAQGLNMLKEKTAKLPI